MPFIGNKPSAVPLTSADIADSIITSAKIVDGTIANADIANSTIALAKLSATGTADATTFLRGDNSWGSAGAAAGQVIQVLSATDSTQRTTSSTSYVTASNTLSVSITPASASNKILIIASTNCWGNGSGSARFTLYKNSTDLSSGGNGFGHFEQNNIASPHGASSFTFLDSPNTTSSTTYQVYMKIVTYAGYMNFGNTTGSITCLEIKG